MPSGSVTRRIFLVSPSGSMIDGRDHRLAGLDASILAGEANLLGVGILALQAEFGPGRIDQLNLLSAGLPSAGGRGCSRRRGAAERPVRVPRERLSAQPSARAFGARGRRSVLGLGLGRKQ